MSANYLLKRLGHALLVVLIVSLIAFSLGEAIGDPVTSMLGMEASQEDRDALVRRLGLDQPYFVRYADFMMRLVSGEMGMSYRSQRPVADLIAERIPATVELAVAGLSLSLLMGVPLGIVTAIWRHRWWANLLMTTSVVGVSLPTFVVGILLIFLFSVHLGWLPSFGRGQTVNVGGWETGFLTRSGLLALIMPALSLAISQMALVGRLVRAEMVEVLRSDYIRFARARGIKDSTVNFVHALRNTIIPIITISGIQIGYLVAFAVVVEQVFQWPGMGSLFLGALTQSDVPVITTFLVLVAFFFAMTNLVVDMLYALVDPRIQLGRKG